MTISLWLLFLILKLREFVYNGLSFQYSNLYQGIVKIVIDKVGEYVRFKQKVIISHETNT